MTYEMVDFQKDETKLRAKAKKGTITDEEFFKEMKRLHKRATESIVIEDNKILLDTPYGYKQVSTIEDDVAYLYDGAVVQLTPEEVDEISGNTIEEEIDVGQVYEAGTSDGAKKGWDKRGRGRKAEDEPEHEIAHTDFDDTSEDPEVEDDPYDTRPVGADGQRLGKSDEEWEKEGYDVDIQRQNGIIAVTKNGEDVWFSQSHEDNVAMFGDDWDNWDSQLILNTLSDSGQMGEWDSQLDSGYDPSTGDKKEEPDGNKQKELETHKEERSKGKTHNDLTLQKKWLKSPEDVEKATDEEIFALANGAQMHNSQIIGDDLNPIEVTGKDSDYYKKYIDGLRQSMSADLFGSGSSDLEDGGSNNLEDGGKGGSKPMGLKDVWVSEKNYGFKSNDEGGLDLSLHDDMAGWMWNGDETDLIDYVNRVSGTNFKDEFIKKMNDSNVPFESIRDQMLRNLEENPDSLYAVSGDNRRWKFGEGTEIDMGIIDDEIDAIAPDLTPEQRQQVKDTVDEFAEGGSYEGFMESEHGGQLKDLVEGAIQNSNSFEDLFFQFGDWENGLGYSKAELEMYYNDELTRDAIMSAVNNVKNQKAVTESLPKWECLDCYQKFDDAGKHQEETGHHNITKNKGDIDLNSPEGRDWVNDINKHASKGGKWNRIREPYETGDDWSRESKASEEFKEEEHPREDDGQFASKGDGDSSGGDKKAGKFEKMDIKKLLKSITHGTDGKKKDWRDIHIEEHQDEFREIERRNREIPKPKRPAGAGKIFRDDPDVVSKMEEKIKYLEEIKDYWKKITKFPVRDFRNVIGIGTLGDAKWYEMSNNSQLLNGARKKLEQVKNQGTLTRNTTYKSDQFGKSKPRFYYTEEPKDSGEGYADRKSDLNKAWKSWKRGLKNHPDENTYNDWFDFAKDNGATDEEADDTWDSQKANYGDITDLTHRYGVQESKANEVRIERSDGSMKINGKNVIKIWESFSGWYWYAIEDQGSYTGVDQNGNDVQAHAWYGYVQGMENEWGTWDSNELERSGVWTVPKSNWGWTGRSEESKAREARIHQQTDVKKKWLERCETCGDIRSSHTAGIDHSFKVDATGVEFVDKGNVFENSILIKSGLQPKRYSKEYISQQIQYEAQKWWHDNYAKKHGRKDFREMTIIEKKKVFLAFLESVVGYGAKLPDYKPTKKGKSYEEDVIAIYETVKRNANEVRKVLMEAKQVRFNNPDPKFWWNADERRTGMVLNEFKRAGLEWYSVNSAGQLYDVLKDEAELVAGENKPLKEMSNDELLSAREYVYGTYKNLGYMKQIEAEIKDRGIGNPNFKKDWKDEETRDDKSVENDKRSEKDLEEIINEGITEDITKFIEDPFTLYDKYKKGKGNDEIDKSLELEADEMHEDIHEAKPNTLIRYANPRKLPNGKTVMDRVRTSHPQVLETVSGLPDNVSSHFSDWDGSCNICGKQMYVDDGSGGWKGEWIDLEEHLDKEHGIKYNGESKSNEDVKDEDWFKEYQRNVDASKSKISDLWKKDEKASELSPEAQCPKCGSYKTVKEKKSSLGYGKRKQYVCMNCYNVFQSKYSPKEIRALYESKADHLQHIEKALDMNLKNQKDYRERAEKDGNPNFNNPDLIKERDNLLKQRKKVIAGESKASEYDAMKDVSFKEGGHYGQAGYCPICDWKTTEEDWLTDIEIHLSEGHGIRDNDDRDVILRRAFESKAEEFDWEGFDEYEKDYLHRKRADIFTGGDLSQNAKSWWDSEDRSKFREKMLVPTSVDINKSWDQHDGFGQMEIEGMFDMIAYEEKWWGESKADVDLTCGMCNGTGEIYMDTIVTCHECNGTGKITFEQLPQWKKEQYASERNYRDNPINILDSAGLYDNWGYWDTWSRSDKYDLLMDRGDYDASEEDEYLTVSWSQLPDYMKKELNMAMWRRGEPTDDPYDPQFSESKANEGIYIYDCDYCDHHEESEYPDIEGHLKNIHGITDYQEIKQARNDLQRDETTFDPYEEEMLPKWREGESKASEVYPNYNTIPHPSDEDCPTSSDGLCICDTCDIDELIFNYNLGKFEHGNGNAKCKTCSRMKGNMPLAKESKASEGGFGSGKRGHSSWMKDIEFGGNYKKCPLCNINTNFTSGKCEICGNSFAGEKKKANEMSDDEWMNKIEQLANKTGVKTIAVQNFLISVGSNGSVGNALANLESDTRMYKWNARTVNAIQKGIMIYFDKVKKYDNPPTFEDKYPNTLW